MWGTRSLGLNWEEGAGMESHCVMIGEKHEYSENQLINRFLFRKWSWNMTNYGFSSTLPPALQYYIMTVLLREFKCHIGQLSVRINSVKPKKNTVESRTLLIPGGRSCVCVWLNPCLLTVQWTLIDSDTVCTPLLRMFQQPRGHQEKKTDY